MLYKTALLLALLLWGCEYPFQNEQNKDAPIWVFVESAERQCITPDYSSLEEAVQQLENNNIQVFDSSEVNYVVCRACTCPSGTNYNALINLEDENNALELGWQRVDEGDDTPD